MAGFAAICAPGTTENARANGDTRTIYLHHAHTQESIAATYMVDGQYDSGVLEKLNWFLRDWRREESTHMDPRLFDVIWTVYRESGSARPIEVMSAYRSPETNAMLRRRSRAVAEHSQHILGKAMDQHYVDVPMSRIREIAMKLQRGGVGFYPTAGTPFVHMDVGGVRHWPRMSYDQLARLFPDGKTVHIPSNGQPLPGYEEARAELEARGDSFNYPTAGEVKSKGFFAWLFGGSDEEEDAAASGGRVKQDPPLSRQRVASLDRGPTGSLPAGTGFGLQSKDAGMRAFNAGAVNPAAPASVAPQRRAPIQPPPPAVVAQKTPEISQPDPQAQQRLAEAMAKQQRAAEQPPAIVAPPASAPLPPAVPSLQIADATTAPTAPMPPRRPIELASDGPAAPLPPGRPVEFASLAPLKPGKPGPMAAVTPSALSGLPAVITQGPGAPKVPAVLAYAAPLPPTPPSQLVAPQARMAVPLPLPRPNFVAARLDRSNFRGLTGGSVALKAPVRSGIGSAVMALRPAARMSLSLLADQPSSDVAQSFSNTPTDLAFDHFSGSAIKPREHVVTAGTASPTSDN